MNIKSIGEIIETLCNISNLSENCRRSDGWCKRWITKQSMVQAMDHEAVEEDMDQEAVEGAMQAMQGAIDGRNDGSRSSRRRYGSGS